MTADTPPTAAQQMLSLRPGSTVLAILQEQPTDPKMVKARAINARRLKRAQKTLALILKSYESRHNHYREEYGLIKAATLVLGGAERWLS